RILYCACLLAMAFALPVDDANAKVNRVTGDYSEQHIDLSVQAPGGEISVLRYYLRGRLQRPVGAAGSGYAG
ncbi:MAG: hypothetical protein COW62_04510, partial [Zetaproteobacteria bacterium CG17_big_fil_post_rev_8_21_14_2_50_50_13]